MTTSLLDLQKDLWTDEVMPIVELLHEVGGCAQKCGNEYLHLLQCGIRTACNYLRRIPDTAETKVREIFCTTLLKFALVHVDDEKEARDLLQRLCSVIVVEMPDITSVHDLVSIADTESIRGFVVQFHPHRLSFYMKLSVA